MEAICELADDLRRQVVGDKVTYMVNRNINFHQRLVAVDVAVDLHSPGSERPRTGRQRLDLADLRG